MQPAIYAVVPFADTVFTKAAELFDRDHLSEMIMRHENTEPPQWRWGKRRRYSRAGGFADDVFLWLAQLGI